MQARAIIWNAAAADKFGLSAIGSALNELGPSPSASTYPRSDLLSTPIFRSFTWSRLLASANRSLEEPRFNSSSSSAIGCVDP